MRENTHAMTCLARLLFAVLAAACVACEKTPQEDKPVVPDPVEVLTQRQADERVALLAARCATLAILNGTTAAEAGKVWEDMVTLAGQPSNEYITPKSGVWGRVKSLYDFEAEVAATGALHRTVLLCVMARCEALGGASRDRIYETIAAATAVPDYCKVGSARFWDLFPQGKLDLAAVNIYQAVFSQLKSYSGAPAQKIADYMAANNLGPADLMRKCAASLIEAGGNAAFGYDNNLMEYDQPAGVFLNDHGQALLEALNGNITSEACANAIGANINLLAGGLETLKIPDSQSLMEMAADMSQTRTKELQQEMERALADAATCPISDCAAAWFALRTKIVLGEYTQVLFADTVYEAQNDQSEIYFRTDAGDAHTFRYTDREGRMLLEGKCAVGDAYLSLRVDYLTPEASGLLPRKSQIAVGDIVNIPYTTIDDDWGGIQMVYLWVDSRDQNAKAFVIQFSHESISVMPYLIDIGKEGGQIAVDFDHDTYKYFGAYADEQCNQWLTIARDNDNFVLTVTENTSGLPRGGEIFFWATDIKAAADAMAAGPDLSYMEGLRSTYVTASISQAAR